MSDLNLENTNTEDLVDLYNNLCNEFGVNDETYGVKLQKYFYGSVSRL